MKSVIEYLELSEKSFPDKTAVVDEHKKLTYSELADYSRRVGGRLVGHIKKSEPVAVYMEKSAETLCAFFGIVYAGGCYSLLNTELPEGRIRSIIEVLSPNVIITSEELYPRALCMFQGKVILRIEELLMAPLPDSFYCRRFDVDPLYINFTSGSTGVPKGIVVGNRSVLDFIDCFTDTFSICSDDIIANQAPFDFDVSVKDIYSALKVGATLVIVPRRMFTAPVELVEFLVEHNVTTMIWAVSALCLLSTFHAFDYKTPSTINKILFSGEVMPLKHLNTFRKHLPEAMFVNLYGPTEITCNCTYHILDKNVDYADGIPIGIPFENEDVFLLDESDKRIEAVDSIGEICVRGTALALGYYSAPEQNKKSFVQNPLNPRYPEIIYRTGDLGKFNEDGELVFCGRKDFQIKYLGHRIELEEIERAIAAIDGVERCCCIFDEKRSRLKGFYMGEIDKEELNSVMKKTFPSFMIPGVIKKVDNMPLTKNGKIDRKALAEISGGSKA